MSDIPGTSSTPLRATDRVSQKRPQVDSDDSDGGEEAVKGHTPKRPRPTSETRPPFDSIGINLKPEYLPSRLERARARRNAYTKQLRSRRARLQEAILELSMVLDEIEELAADRKEVDRFIGRVKALMFTHNIFETRPRGSASWKDAFDEDGGEVIS